MTIPVVVMIVSAVVWLLITTVAKPTPEAELPEVQVWLVDICRILFAASALIVLYGLMNKSVF